MSFRLEMLQFCEKYFISCIFIELTDAHSKNIVYLLFNMKAETNSKFVDVKLALNIKSFSLLLHHTGFGNS